MLYAGQRPPALGSASSSRTVFEHAVLHTPGAAHHPQVPRAPRQTCPRTALAARPTPLRPGRPGSRGRQGHASEPGERYTQRGRPDPRPAALLDQRPGQRARRGPAPPHSIPLDAAQCRAGDGRRAGAVRASGPASACTSATWRSRRFSDAEAVSSFRRPSCWSPPSSDRHGTAAEPAAAAGEQRAGAAHAAFEGQPPQVKDKVPRGPPPTWAEPLRRAAAEQRLASAREHWGDDARRPRTPSWPGQAAIIQDNSWQVIALLEPLLPGLRRPARPRRCADRQRAPGAVMACGRARFAESETLFQEERARHGGVSKPDHQAATTTTRNISKVQRARATDRGRAADGELRRHGHLANERQQRFVRA